MHILKNDKPADNRIPIDRPVFVQKVHCSHKHARLNIGAAVTIKVKGISHRVKLTKKAPIKKGEFIALMFELT